MKYSIRDLFNKICEYEGDKVYQNLLFPWVENSNYNEFIVTISNKLNLTKEENWELYALSRVLDILTLKFQPNNNSDNSNWLGPQLTINEFYDFVKYLGLEINFPKKYDAYNCEILRSIEGNENFEIINCLFPSVKLGKLLIKRSGVIITNKTTDYNLDLINNSIIYWASRRKNKGYRDLSQGWGSNSQWITEFRIDFETDEMYIYNSNGKFDLNELSDDTLTELNEQNLEINEAIEILTNRNFIKCKKDDKDLFPYDFKYSEKKNYA